MLKILTATLAASVLVAGAAQSGTATTTIAVSATVVATCSASATALPFGNYTPGAGALAGTSTISIKCTKNAPYTIALDKGLGTGASFTTGRLMTSGANTLVYNLYTTAGYTSVFGDTTGGSVTVAGTGNGVAAGTAAQTVTVYGQLPDSATNQGAAIGAYADTVTVSVTY